MACDFLFEISWEVCNKVGGIHTVLESKVFMALKNFKNYYLMGPYLNENSNEFVEGKIPENFKIFYDELLKIGIKIHFGVWNILEKPNVILIEHLGYSKNINDIKTKLWENYKIDSLGSNWYDFDEAILWSWCCGIVIDKLTKNISNTVLVHSHEWMSGGAIFYLKQIENNLKYKTIFTTHATMLGRTISSSNIDLYKNISKLDSNKLSYDFNIATKHQTESALANFSDCFTTVSNITNLEAEKFYLKSADVLIPNGFDNKINYDVLKSSDFLKNFLNDFSKNSYELDLKNCDFLYTSGRNEFKDKGVDLYIDSLGKLNKKLKSEKFNRTVINFFLIPIGNFEKKSFENNLETLPYSTHKINSNCVIIDSFLKNGLYNLKEDLVKVILIPIYLDKFDNFFNKNYYEIISGMDLGIFPSIYEPWGYTPLESISYGVPTITSNLAGFGRWVFKNFQNSSSSSVKILDRENLNFENSSNQLVSNLYDFIHLDISSRENLKLNSFDLSKKFSWEIFYENYLKAYDFAKKS